MVLPKKGFNLEGDFYSKFRMPAVRSRNSMLRIGVNCNADPEPAFYLNALRADPDPGETFFKVTISLKFA
jgi:hypothetical protein